MSETCKIRKKASEAITCCDCKSRLSRTYRIRNKLGLFLCRVCSNLRRKKQRKQCNDCGKELNRSYKCKNVWSIDLCNSCNKKREFTLQSPRFGFRKHHQPWSKGLTKETSTIIKSASSKKTGVLWSDERKRVQARNQLRGEKHPLYGKHLSIETREKISLSHKGQISPLKGKDIWADKNHPWIGKHHTEETKQLISMKRKGQQSPKKGKQQLATTGDRNPSWQGGTSFLPYCYKFNNNLKEEIRNNYDRTCLNCGLKEEDNVAPSGHKKRLAVHHVTYDKQQGCKTQVITLVPLCNSCHGRTQANRKQWEGHLMYLSALYQIKNVMSLWSDRL